MFHSFDVQAEAAAQVSASESGFAATQLRKAIRNLTRHHLASATQCPLQGWVALPAGLGVGPDDGLLMLVFAIMASPT